MRTMVFIDYQNYNISAMNYFKSEKNKYFNVNFSLMAHHLTEKLPFQSTLLKTYLFAYKPCDELMKLEQHKRYYNWLSSLKNKPYFEVIEGSQEIRRKIDVDFDINDVSTYTTKEKGTDINLAVNMLTKAYQNAFDIAILVSGDTDYIPVIEALHQIGKIVVIAHLPDQNIAKYQEYHDAHIKMDLDFLKLCVK